jgi:hypothetical protein
LPEKTVTLGEYMVSRVGLIKATKVAAFVYSWGIYIENEEARPTMEGYTAYWRQSISTTYRERDLFTICWPEEKNPTALWLRIRAFAGARIESKKRRELGAVQVLGLQLPGLE